ncbi:hypothetical protein NL676_019170 [Syzygium grande]|nr:hypothetical protein NL676_019170 [Syzygium grande]
MRIGNDLRRIPPSLLSRPPLSLPSFARRREPSPSSRSVELPSSSPFRFPVPPAAAAGGSVWCGAVARAPLPGFPVAGALPPGFPPSGCTPGSSCVARGVRIGR